MKYGVFLPTANNGWLISNTAPQYKPTWELEKRIALEAEAAGMDFAIAMVKLHGYGGQTEFWDYSLDSFTLIAGLAAVTERLQLFASVAVLAQHPAMVARMAMTLDAIAPGRVGVNMVSGWQKAEYAQMGLWPGDETHFRRRYDVMAEYAQVLTELWREGTSDFKGEFFTLDQCRMKPTPSAPIPICVAGQSPEGMGFAAKWAGFNLFMGRGCNTPTAHAPAFERLATAAADAGRSVQPYSAFMIIVADTDEEAHARWERYREGADVEAIAWMTGQALADTTSDSASTAKTISLPYGAVNLNTGTLVGSPETVARLLNEAAALTPDGGILLTFDNYVGGIRTFGERIRPLLDH